MSSLSISASGLNDASLRLFAVSSNVANLNTPAPTTVDEVTSEAAPNGQGVRSSVGTRESVFGVDLVSEVLNLQLARQGFEANARVLQATNDTLGTLIDAFNSSDGYQ